MSVYTTITGDTVQLSAPSAFEVMGQTFIVNMVPRDHRFVVGTHDFCGRVGENELDLQRVSIIGHDTGLLSENQELNVYLHEVLHAVLYLGGFVAGEVETEHEKLIAPLATHLLAFMRNNIDVMNYLLQEVDLS